MSKPINRCRECHLPRDEGRPISKRGLCPLCAKRRVAENMDAMLNKSGPAYNKYITNWIGGMSIYNDHSHIEATPTRKTP